MSETNYYCPTCGKGYDTSGICNDDGTDLRVRVLNTSEQLDKKPSKVAAFLDAFKGVNDKNRPPVPESLAELKVESAPESLNGYHQWKCSISNKGKFNHRVFGSEGSLTANAVYSRIPKLISSTLSCFPILESYGSCHLQGGVYVDYELTEYDDSYAPIAEWLDPKEISEQRTIHLARAFAILLEDCLKADVLPMAISPDDLLFKQVNDQDDIHLKFVHLATMTEGTGAVVYRGDLSSVLLPSPWSAPEFVAERKATTNSVVFSIGQLLTLSLFGEVFDHDDIRNGRIPFSKIKSDFAAHLLMGCLWPYPEGRFTPNQFVEMLEKQNAKPEKWPASSIWESLPANGSTGVSFSGKLYFRPRDLAQILVQPDKWDEAVASLPDILNWVKKNTHHKSLAEMLIASDRTEDWKLIRLAYSIAPELPKTWRTISIDDDNVEKSLIALAQKALQSGKEKDNDSAKLIDQFFKSNLRDAFLNLENIK